MILPSQAGSFIFVYERLQKCMLSQWFPNQTELGVGKSRAVLLHLQRGSWPCSHWPLWSQCHSNLAGVAAAATAAPGNMRTSFCGCSLWLGASTSGLSSAQAQVFLAFSWYSVQTYCVLTLPWGVISNEQFSAETGVVPLLPEVVFSSFMPFPSLHRVSCLSINIWVSPHCSWLQGCCACLMHGAQTGLAGFSRWDTFSHPSATHYSHTLLPPEWGVPRCVKITALNWTLWGPLCMEECYFRWALPPMLGL